MTSNWLECSVADIAASIKNALVGGPFDSNLVSRDYVPLGVPEIRGQNMGHGRWVEDEFVFVSNEKADALSPNTARSGDLIFTQRGTLGQVAIVPIGSFDRYIISQSQMKLTVDQNKADALFLYYVFTSAEQQEYIIRNAIQTGVPHTNLEHLRTTPLILPSLSEQRVIANILGTLDDKIELNRRMNETLEALARAIFKSWFFDFDPVRVKMEGRQPAGMDAETAALFPAEFEDSALGQIPKGWKIGIVNDLGEIVTGKTPPTSEPENYSIDMPFITIPDMHGKVFVIETAKCLSRLGVSVQKSKTLPAHAICVSCIATPGLVVMTSEPSQTNQQINSVVPTDMNAAYYCYYALLELADEIIARGSGGSVVTNLNKGQFSILPVLIPPTKLMHVFQDAVEPLFGKLLANERGSRTLAALRDTLLPKLLSGEVRVV